MTNWDVIKDLVKINSLCTLLQWNDVIEVLYNIYITTILVDNDKHYKNN